MKQASDLNLFMSTLLESLPEEAQVANFCLPNRQTHFFGKSTLDQMVAWVESQVKNQQNVFIGLNPLRKGPINGRGKNTDVGYLLNFSADFDFKGEGHRSGKNYPPDWEAIKTQLALHSCPLPTLVIRTGHGVHAHWNLKAPIAIKDASEAGTMMQHFHRALATILAKQGYETDNTSDLARVYRLPETINFKDPSKPLPVEIWPDESCFLKYDLAELITWADSIACEDAHSKIISKTGYKHLDEEASAQIMVEHCLFLQHCRENAVNLPENQWFAMINNLALAKNGGADVVHQLSQDYPKYTTEETQDRIDRAQREQKPHMCQTIKDFSGFTNCPYEGCSVKSPIALVTNPWSKSLEAITDLLNENTNLLYLSKRHKEDLVALRNQATELHDRLMTKIEPKMSKRNFNRLQREIDQMAPRAPKTTISEEANARLTELAGFPCRLPRGYQLNPDNSISFFQGSQLVEVIERPLIISAYYKSDTDELRELSFGTKKIIVSAKTIATAGSLVKLADEALPISEVNARAVMRYLHEFQRENRANIPSYSLTRSLGWQSDESFLPNFSTFNLLLPNQSKPIDPAYWTHGDLDDWLRIATEASRFPYARLMLAAAFAAPLLKLLKHRNFILYIYGTSTGGKSAASMLAASVWGPTDEFFHQLSGSDAGIEGVLSRLRNLPLFLDERQSAKRDQKGLDALIYDIANGKGKLRGSWDSTTSSLGSVMGERWQTVSCATGEHALTSFNSPEGTQNRILEIYCKSVVDDPKLASLLHQIDDHAYGVAGEAFMRSLLEIPHEERVENITDTFSQFSTFLSEKNINVATGPLSHLAVLAVSDFLIQEYLLQIEGPIALAETQNWIQSIAESLPLRDEMSESNRAYHYLKDWYQQKKTHFTKFDKSFQGDVIERYGWEKEPDLLVLPTVISEALSTKGFNFDRLKREWERENRLRVHKSGKNKIDFTINIKRVGRVIYLKDFLAPNDEGVFEHADDGEFVLTKNEGVYKKEVQSNE